LSGIKNASTSICDSVDLEVIQKLKLMSYSNNLLVLLLQATTRT